MSFFESLRRLFGGDVRPRTNDPAVTQDPSSGEDPSDGSDSLQDTAVAMISCDEASARLFEYLDGELEGVSDEEVRRHLEVCKACYPRAQFEKHFLEALQRSQNGGSASASLRERVLRSLAEEHGAD